MSCTYSASRVATPTHTTKMPVANGSRVPVWPMRVPDGNQRWTRSTTAREDIPSGLSMTSKPWKDCGFMERFSGKDRPREVQCSRHAPRDDCPHAEREDVTWKGID